MKAQVNAADSMGLFSHRPLSLNAKSLSVDAVPGTIAGHKKPTHPASEATNNSRGLMPASSLPSSLGLIRRDGRSIVRNGSGP